VSEWRSTTLGEEIELAYGKALPARTRTEGNVEVYGSNGVVGSNGEALFNGPGIVVGRKGTVGATVYARGPYWPIDTTYYVVRKHEHDWRFLYHLLLASGLTTLNSHSTVPGLNREDVYRLPVAIPGVREQEQISAVLDLLREAVDGQGAALEVTEALKRAVMQGLFTRGLRGGESQDSEIGPIPAGWKVERFADIREWLQYGTSARSELDVKGSPVLRIPNVAVGRVSTRELKYATLSAQETAKYLLESGDLLFIRTNGVKDRLGTCAVYNGEPEGALFASYLIRARLKPEIEPRFAAYFFASPIGTPLVTDRATPASDGKFNLNTATIDDLPIPMPPTIQEQQEIVDILDALDAKIDLHRQKKALYEELFQALLHGLMTQEIDVNDLNLSALPEREAVPT
jgi:type I restriction enzyme S subunit